MKNGNAFLTAFAVALIDSAVKGFIKDPPVKNYGFAGNRMDDHPETVACVSAVLSGVMLVALAAAPEKLKLPMALITGGALSNTADRLIRGYVVDYIPMGKKYYGNLSDFAIFLGAGMTSIKCLLEGEAGGPASDDVIPS